MLLRMLACLDFQSPFHAALWWRFLVGASDFLRKVTLLVGPGWLDSLCHVTCGNITCMQFWPLTKLARTKTIHHTSLNFPLFTGHSLWRGGRSCAIKAWVPIELLGVHGWAKHPIHANHGTCLTSFLLLITSMTLAIHKALCYSGDHSFIFSYNVFVFP